MAFEGCSQILLWRVVNKRHKQGTFNTYKTYLGLRKLQKQTNSKTWVKDPSFLIFPKNKSDLAINSGNTADERV